MTEIEPVTWHHEPEGRRLEDDEHVNIAGALAARGLDVLAVDMDPQGYLSHQLGFEDECVSEPPSLYDALQSPGDHALAHNEFDPLPSNIDMFYLEQDLIANGTCPRIRLEDVLEKAPEWDIILVDAPPSLAPLNDNVVLATEELLVPVEADESSQFALNSTPTGRTSTSPATSRRNDPALRRSISTTRVTPTARQTR